MGSQELTPEEKLKSNLIFKYLKTGKIPKRKGLFRILFFLAEEHKNFKGITMTSSSVTIKRPNIDRTIQIKVKDKLDLDKIKSIFNEYLINFDYKIEAHIVGVNLMTIYYSSKDIKWALIDEELRINHKDNIKEVEGFPRIISYEKK